MQRSSLQLEYQQGMARSENSPPAIPIKKSQPILYPSVISTRDTARPAAFSPFREYERAIYCEQEHSIR